MSKVFDFKVGQEVIMIVQGAGIISEEIRTVEEVNNGVVKLGDCDKEFGLDGKWLGIDNFFRFNFYIKPATE